MVGYSGAEDTRWTVTTTATDTATTDYNGGVWFGNRQIGTVANNRWTITRTITPVYEWGNPRPAGYVNGPVEYFQVYPIDDEMTAEEAEEARRMSDPGIRKNWFGFPEEPEEQLETWDELELM